MAIVTLAIEAEIITAIKAKNPKGKECLLKYYSAPLYGMIRRMHDCPVLSYSILEKSLVKVCADIYFYDNAKFSFFIWMVQIVRKLSISQIDFKLNEMVDDKHINTAFSLVLNKGFNLGQAAKVLQQTTQEVAYDLHQQLKQKSRSL